MSENQPSNMETLDKALAALVEGDSFFVEAVTPDQLAIVRRRAYKLGFKTEIRFVLNDEIFVGKSGSRVWHRGPVAKRSRKHP